MLETVAVEWDKSYIIEESAHCLAACDPHRSSHVEGKLEGSIASGFPILIPYLHKSSDRLGSSLWHTRNCNGGR